MTTGSDDNATVMVLCGGSPRHLYVANYLCGVLPVVAIVQETGSHWTWAKVRKLLKPATLWSKASRWVRDRRRYQDGGEARFFFGERKPALERPDLRVAVPHINHPDVVALADRLRPDVIAVFGTSLIRGALLERGRLGMLNLHGGLSPDYRGADCTFWALYNNEPEQVGCTLHFINAGIDTGKLVAHVCPQVGPGDGELSLFWRAVQDSAAVYVEAIRRLGRGEPLGQEQTRKGRLYQVKDRLARHEHDLERRLRDGMLAGVDIPPRVRWFTPDGS